VGENTNVWVKLKVAVMVGVKDDVTVGVGEKKSVANASFVRICSVVLVAGVTSPPVFGITRLACCRAVDDAPER
jgi:hypothetical protein